MKNQFKTAALVAIMALGSANAQSINGVKTIDTGTFMANVSVRPDTKILRVTLARNNENENPVHFKIKDARSEVVYFKTMGRKEKQSLILLDMSQIENGDYFIEIGDKTQNQLIPFKKWQEQITEKPYVLALK